jgi:hypothetical protein
MPRMFDEPEISPAAPASGLPVDPVAVDPIAGPDVNAGADVADVPDLPRSRRAVLAGAVGGLAGLIAGRLGNPDRAAAAAGSPLIIGSEANNAGSADTQLVANSSVISLKVYQQGPGTALMGYVTRTSGDGRGVYGRTDSPNGDGVQARNGAAAGTGAAFRAIGGANPAIIATSTSATGGTITATNSNPASAWAAVEGTGPTGVRGTALEANDVGVVGSSTSWFGIMGFSGTGVGVGGSCTTGHGVRGNSQSSAGVKGESNTSIGVFGTSNSWFGVWGDSAGDQPGVLGTSTNGAGVYASSVNSTALYVEGNASVTGSLSKGAGSFQIDHPLDPANQYLSHSFVESPDMMNIYNGNVTLDAAGEATIALPDWWEALNRDARFQLTPIGSFMPLFVKEAIRKNAFQIAGGTAGRQVSWQVTGIRKDAYAEANRIPVEHPKSAADRGKYLHPKEHGQPASKGVDHAMRSRIAADLTADAAARKVAPIT